MLFLAPAWTLAAAMEAAKAPAWLYYYSYVNGNVPDWKPFTRATPSTMDFGDKPELLPAIFPERMAFQQEVIRKAIERDEKARAGAREAARPEPARP